MRSVPVFRLANDEVKGHRSMKSSQQDWRVRGADSESMKTHSLDLDLDKNRPHFSQLNCDHVA